MYSTCMFCNSDLGANEVIEHFPVGRRLAFDSATGRLWVVCRKCERWNLSPIEERWEAVEECERAFRDTKLRASTDNIGLARVSEGLELVRIGRPQRPEMAAWRYGDQFGRRRRRYYTYTAVGAVAMGGVLVAGPMLGLYAAGSMGSLVQVPQWIFRAYRSATGKVKIALPWLDEPYVISASHVQSASLMHDDNALGWALHVRISKDRFKLPDAPARITDPPVPRIVTYKAHPNQPIAVFTGTEAIRIAGRILPKVNISGAGADDVKRAVGLLEADADPARFFGRQVAGRTLTGGGQALGKIPKPVRLALEMSAHEDTERRALEGELAMLDAAWREADEIAGIADNLLLPAEVDTWFARLKRRR